LSDRGKSSGSEIRQDGAGNIQVIGSGKAIVRRAAGDTMPMMLCVSMLLYSYVLIWLIGEAQPITADEMMLMGAPLVTGALGTVYLGE